MSSVPNLRPEEPRARVPRHERRPVAVALPAPVVLPRVVVAPRARRVVFLNRFYYPDISATSQLLTDLARRLARIGYDVHVICSRQRYDGPAVPLPAAETIDGVNVHRVWSTRFGRGFLPARMLDYLSFYPAAVLEVLRVVRRGDVVVAKTDPPLLSVAVGPAVRLRGGRLVNWLQDIFPEIADRLRAPRLPGGLVRWLMSLRDGSLHKASMNVVLGPGMRDYLSRRQVPDSKLRVVGNWAVDEPEQPIPPGESVLRRSLGVDAHFVVGYSGNLGLTHDYSTLLGAAEKLRAHEDVLFLMVGGGAGMRELQAQAHARGLANFRFLPYQARDRLADSLAAADVHLVTQLPVVEGLMVPSKLYGVMAVGRPVVFVGDVDGEVARAVERAGCGLSANVGDADQLVAALLSLKADASLCARLSANAAEAYTAHHRFDAVATRWVQLLNELTT